MNTHLADATRTTPSPPNQAGTNQTGVVHLPDRALFWKWVWSAIRPAVGWILAAAGTVALVIGWFGVSGESLTAKQLPYLVSAGLAGIALFIMAGVFLATDDIRRQFERISELERKVDDLYALFVADLATPAAPRSPARPAATDGELVALPTGSSYHRADCSLVAGKDEAGPVSRQEIERRRLRACRVCDPGQIATG
jgi:hypothetical protein